MDSKKKSIVKSITWYSFHNVMMFTIGFAFTGSVETGLAIALIQTAGESVLYYFHERAWTRWGHRIVKDKNISKRAA